MFEIEDARNIPNLIEDEEKHLQRMKIWSVTFNKLVKLVIYHLDILIVQKMRQGKSNKQYLYRLQQGVAARRLYQLSTIEKNIFRNIRLVNTQKSFEGLIDINKGNHYAFIALIKSF